MSDSVSGVLLFDVFGRDITVLYERNYIKKHKFLFLRMPKMSDSTTSPGPSFHQVKVKRTKTSHMTYRGIVLRVVRVRAFMVKISNKAKVIVV